jgi:DNA-binding NarL/FixJ family response regulator
MRTASEQVLVFRPRRALQGREVAHLARLRPREWEVLNLLATGATNAEMAERLQLAEGTIRNVVATLTCKLGVADRTQAALLAAREGLGRHEIEFDPEDKLAGW